MNDPSTCPHFSICSGCQVSRNVFTPPVWIEVLSFFEKIEPDLKPRLFVDGFEKSRLKAKLAVRTPCEIGLFKKNTHEVVSIPECLVHHPSINKAAALISHEMRLQNIAAYQEGASQGLVRYLQFFVDRQTQKIQLAIVVNAEKATKELADFCQGLLKHDLWHSIWLNFHPVRSNRVLGESWQLIEGEPFLWQKLNHTSVAFHPGAFSQAHLSLFEKMLQQIEVWVKPQDRVLELYAGVGAIGLTLVRKARSIYFVENNPFAEVSWQESAQRLSEEQRQKVHYTCSAAGDFWPDSDLIIVDPPRKGLDDAVLGKLCQLDRSRLIYVSCGFDSFQKDCIRLLAANWKLKEAQGYLLFPGTNHVETLALFEKSL